jgi:hypothetical protein
MLDHRVKNYGYFILCLRFYIFRIMKRARTSKNLNHDIL